MMLPQETVWGLVELLSLTVTMLGTETKNRPACRVVLNRLANIAKALESSSPVLAKRLFERVASLRAEVSLGSADYAAALRWAQHARRLAARGSASHICSTLIAINALFMLGRSKEAYGLLARELRYVVKRSPNDIDGFLKVALRPELELTHVPALLAAMTVVTRRSSNMTGTEFLKRWNRDRRAAVRALMRHRARVCVQ